MPWSPHMPSGCWPSVSLTRSSAFRPPPFSSCVLTLALPLVPGHSGGTATPQWDPRQAPGNADERQPCRGRSIAGFPHPRSNHSSHRAGLSIPPVKLYMLQEGFESLLVRTHSRGGGERVVYTAPPPWVLTRGGSSRVAPGKLTLEGSPLLSSASFFRCRLLCHGISRSW